MFVEITDPDKAWELYQAGLLWECMRHKRVTNDGCKARVWDDVRHMSRCLDCWSFFILTEE